MNTGRSSKYLVGTWTFTDPARPQGTALHTLDANGPPEITQLDSAATAVYYGAVEPGAGSMLLLHNDLGRSALSRQAWDSTGRLVEQGRWSSGGEGGSYIAFDQTGRYFAVANAKAGWTVFRNGEQPELIAQVRNEGSGPHPRQARSHPHCVIFSPDNRWIIATDMGTDEVLAFAFDAQTGAVGQKICAYRARPGSGPRHILFHRGVAYLLNELGNTLVVLRPCADGLFAELQVVTTLPADFAGDSHTAHLAIGPSANLLLASNRGHDSIVTFVLAEDGLVLERQWSASGGQWPWFFAVTESGALLVANTLSDRISSLEFDGVGSFAATGPGAAVRSPVFLARF